MASLDPSPLTERPCSRQPLAGVALAVLWAVATAIVGLVATAPVAADDHTSSTTGQPTIVPTTSTPPTSRPTTTASTQPPTTLRPSTTSPPTTRSGRQTTTTRPEPTSSTSRATIPGPAGDDGNPPATFASKGGPHTGRMSPVLAWLSGLGLASGIGLLVIQWFLTRPEREGWTL